MTKTIENKELGKKFSDLLSCAILKEEKLDTDIHCIKELEDFINFWLLVSYKINNVLFILFKFRF